MVVKFNLMNDHMYKMILPKANQDIHPINLQLMLLPI